MKSNKISIVIPVYETDPKLLMECFKSIDDQEYQNFEVIVVNDSSKKYSILKFINDYVKNHEKYKVINLIENKGPGNARNIGVKNSTGDIIFYMDSDDYITPIALKRVNEVFNEFPDLDIFSFENRVLMVDGIFRNVTQYRFNTEKPVNVNEWNNAMLDKCSVWAKAYKKSFLIDNNIWFLDKDVYMEDMYYLIVTYSKAKQILFKPEPNYILRETINSRTQSSFTIEKMEGLFNAIKSAYDSIKNVNSFISNNYHKLFDLIFNSKMKEHHLSNELINNPKYDQILKEAKAFSKSLNDLKKRN